MLVRLMKIWGLRYLELLCCRECHEVWRRACFLFQRLQKHPLEVQHLWQAAKQRLHLRQDEKMASEGKKQFKGFKGSAMPYNTDDCQRSQEKTLRLRHGHL